MPNRGGSSPASDACCLVLPRFTLRPGRARRLDERGGAKSTGVAAEVRPATFSGSSGSVAIWSCRARTIRRRAQHILLRPEPVFFR